MWPIGGPWKLVFTWNEVWGCTFWLKEKGLTWTGWAGEREGRCLYHLCISCSLDREHIEPKMGGGLSLLWSTRRNTCLVSEPSAFPQRQRVDKILNRNSWLSPSYSARALDFQLHAPVSLHLRGNFRAYLGHRRCKLHISRCIPQPARYRLWMSTHLLDSLGKKSQMCVLLSRDLSKTVRPRCPCWECTQFFWNLEKRVSE